MAELAAPFESLPGVLGRSHTFEQYDLGLRSPLGSERSHRLLQAATQGPLGQFTNSTLLAERMLVSVIDLADKRIDLPQALAEIAAAQAYSEESTVPVIPAEIGDHDLTAHVANQTLLPRPAQADSPDTKDLLHSLRRQGSREQVLEEQVLEEQVLRESGSREQGGGEQALEEPILAEPTLAEQVSEEQISGEQALESRALESRALESRALESPALEEQVFDRLVFREPADRQILEGSSFESEANQLASEANQLAPEADRSPPWNRLPPLLQRRPLGRTPLDSLSESLLESLLIPSSPSDPPEFDPPESDPPEPENRLAEADAPAFLAVSKTSAVEPNDSKETSAGQADTVLPLLQLKSQKLVSRLKQPLGERSPLVEPAEIKPRFLEPVSLATESSEIEGLEPAGLETRGLETRGLETSNLESASLEPASLESKISGIEVLETTSLKTEGLDENLEIESLGTKGLEDGSPEIEIIETEGLEDRSPEIESLGTESSKDDSSNIESLRTESINAEDPQAANLQRKNLKSSPDNRNQLDISTDAIANQPNQVPSTANKITSLVKASPNLANWQKAFEQPSTPAQASANARAQSELVSLTSSFVSQAAEELETEESEPEKIGSDAAAQMGGKDGFEGDRQTQDDLLETLALVVYSQLKNQLYQLRESRIGYAQPLPLCSPSLLTLTSFASIQSDRKSQYSKLKNMSDYYGPWPPDLHRLATAVRLQLEATLRQ